MKEFHNDWCSKAIEKFRLQWTLDPSTAFLNHGSFGAVPKHIRKAQQAIDDEIEADPVYFMLEQYPRLLAQAREALAGFVNARPEQLVFVRNATEGVNALIQSIAINPGDEIIVSNHGYNACNEAIRHAASRRGFTVKQWDIPWPEPSNEALIESLLNTLGPKTKWLVLDHITSPTALKLPIELILERVHSRGARVIIDGAHAPGMLKLSLEDLGADYYVGNLHKWTCNPRGTAFVFARKPEDHLLPCVISHGSSASVVPKVNRFCEAFDWPGTHASSAWFVLPTTLDWFRESAANGNEPIRLENARRAETVAKHFDKHPIAQTRLCHEQRSAMLLLELKPNRVEDVLGTPNQPSLLQRRLYNEWKIQIPVIYFAERTYLRVSIQRYVRCSDIEALDRALHQLRDDGTLQQWPFNATAY